MKNRGLQISFTWMFAIIVGAVILFLAIYASTKLIRSEEGIQDAKTGKEIGILLEPLETGYETLRAREMAFPVQTRIFNKCNLDGYFGRQLIQVSQKSFGKWTETDLDVGFSNKYIFSENGTEGKNFLVFSKPFEFPFKVANLVYMVSLLDSYCFVDAPERIKEEIESINQKNLIVGNCTGDETLVCFESSGCDIKVDYDNDYVVKDGQTVYFEGDALMYAAIFSWPEYYECQVERLMMRVENMAALYKDKGTFILRAGCHSNLNSGLISLSNAAGSLDSSANLKSVELIAEELREMNEDNSMCKLW